MLQIALLADHDGPEDFRVVFQDRQWECDSYFFWIDPALPRDLSLAQALRLLLTQWRASVAGTPEGIRYLPFELNDQSTRWLRCGVRGATITLDAGWSRLEGHRIRLSDIAAASALVTHFQAETPAVILPTAAFLARLTTLIDTLAGEQAGGSGATNQRPH